MGLALKRCFAWFSGAVAVLEQGWGGQAFADQSSSLVLVDMSRGTVQHFTLQKVKTVTKACSGITI